MNLRNAHQPITGHSTFSSRYGSKIIAEAMRCKDAAHPIANFLNDNMPKNSSVFRGTYRARAKRPLLLRRIRA
jgi:hypothetical protein